MKRRTFYIINLDRNRIFVLSTLFIGLIAVAYATGFRLGSAQGPGAGVEALSYQDLMGLPEADLTEEHPGSQHPDVASLDELPPDHPLRQESGLPATDPNALAPRTLSAGDLPPAVDPAPVAEREPLPRLSAPVAAAGPGTPSVNERRREEAAQKKARELRERKAKERRLAKQRREEEARRRQAARAAEARRERERAKALAANEAARRRTIGQSLNQSNTTNFQNTGKSRLNFQKPAETSRRPAPKPAERPVARAERKSEKRTVSLRNVSPGEAPGRASRARQSTENRPRTPRQGREYSLQLGSFSERDSAFRMAGSLKRQGFTPYVYKSGGKFAVRVGKTDRPEYLETLEQRLRSKRYSPMRISYRKKER